MSLRIFSWVPLVLALSSCGTMTAIKEGTVAGVDKVTDLATAPFKPGVPVVEARPDDWKELKSGEQMALAYQEKQRQRRFWLFGPPVDFEEPELPDDAGSTEISLLPEKVE
jgi:hypothetical protein